MPIQVPWLKGVFPALVTPFVRKTEEVDEEAYRRLIRSCLPNVDGLVTSGTTGEFPYLTREEQRRLVVIGVEEAGGKPVIAGCGASSTQEALALARDAKEAGASAALIVTPYFLHPSDKGVYQHYYDIATGVDLPIILYNIPQVMDRTLPRTVVEDLADLPNVVGLKDSSGNLTYTMELLEYVSDRIVIFVGHDEVVLPALAGGVSGMILASAQVYPEVWQEVLRLVGEGKLEEARALQRSVQKLSRIFCRYGGGVAVKAALKMMGLDMGPPRKPLKGVGGASRSRGSAGRLSTRPAPRSSSNWKSRARYRSRRRFSSIPTARSRDVLATWRSRQRLSPHTGCASGAGRLARDWTKCRLTSSPAARRHRWATPTRCN